MKGIQGLIVAIGFGIAGSLLNWAYLASRSSQDATVSFVGIQDGKIVNRGETLREDQVVELTLPERWVGNLKDFAVLYSAKETVIGRPVSRTLSGECLLLTDDLKTPPEGLKLDEGEEMMWIPVESRAFVPSLISPSDEVMFLVPRITSTMRGRPNDGGADTHRPGVGGTTEMGPFHVRALGNRLGSAQVWSAAKLPQLQENVIGIGIKPEEKQKAAALWDVLQATNFRQVGIKKLGPPVKKRQTAG